MQVVGEGMAVDTSELNPDQDLFWSDAAGLAEDELLGLLEAVAGGGEQKRPGVNSSGGADNQAVAILPCVDTNNCSGLLGAFSTLRFASPLPVLPGLLVHGCVPCG